ncbi:MAG: hypothetical protein WCC38_07230 [Pseudonocardiaceae bacterium]
MEDVFVALIALDSSPAGQRLRYRWREVSEPVMAEPGEYTQDL